MMPRCLAAAVGLALLLPASALATDGAATGATTNAEWTQGQVEDVSVTMTDCGSDGQPTCSWAGVAGVVPAAEGGCPADWAEPGDSAFQAFWASPRQSANSTVHSGARSFPLNGAHGQRVCVYLERTFTGTGLSTSFDLLGVLLTQPATQPPDTGACDSARDKLDSAKDKLRRLKDHDAKRSKIRKAKRKVRRARNAVAEAC